MKRGETYSSGYLKAPDMLDQGITEANGINLTIKSIVTQNMDDGNVQRVLSFTDSDQKLGLNATNWDSIAAITGKDDDDLWIGTRINCYPHKLDRPYQGKTHGVRVRAVAGGNAKPGAAPQDAAAARMAAFTALKLTLAPDASADDLKAAWLATIAKYYPGKKQTELTAADWQTVKAGVEGYVGEETPVIADSEIPF